MKRRRLKQGFAALAATAFVLPLASAGAAPPKLPGLTLVSRDTIVDGLALHQSEAQPSLAADGSKQRLVGAFEVGRIYNGGSSAIGFARSDDGGKAWQDGLVPLTVGAGQATTSAGTVWRGADPSAAYDESHGLWLISSTGLGSTGTDAIGLFVNSSKDGKKWSAPIVAHGAAAGDTPQNGSLACDNDPASAGYGTCYIAYTNTSSTPANQLFVVKSTDGGATWSAPAGTPDTSVGHRRRDARPAAASWRRGRIGLRARRRRVRQRDDRRRRSPRATAAPRGRRSRGRHIDAGGTHTVAQGIRTSLVVSGSADGAGALYLVWQTRSFRTAQTTLSAASSAGETNIKVASVTGMVAGNTLTVDPTGSNPETVTIATVGTAGAGGTGVTITPALAFAHAQGAAVTVNGVDEHVDGRAERHRAQRDAGSDRCDAGTELRLAVADRDRGRQRRDHEHGRPLHACDRRGSGLFGFGRAARALLLLLSARRVPVREQPGTDVLAAGRVRLVDRRRIDVERFAGAVTRARLGRGVPENRATGNDGNGNPDFGNVLAAHRRSRGQEAGDAVGLFPVGIAVNGIDVSTYAPKNTLEIGGAS